MPRIRCGRGGLDQPGSRAHEEQGGCEQPVADGRSRSLPPNGQERVAEWLSEVGWPRPDMAEFQLKLIAAAAAIC